MQKDLTVDAPCTPEELLSDNPDFCALPDAAKQAVLFLIKVMDLELDLDTYEDGSTTRLTASACLTINGITVANPKSATWVSNPDY